MLESQVTLFCGLSTKAMRYAGLGADRTGIAGSGLFAGFSHTSYTFQQRRIGRTSEIFRGMRLMLASLSPIKVLCLLATLSSPVLEDRMSLSAIASISSISSISVLDTAFTLASSSKLSPTPPASSASTISAADLRKDLSALLSSLASGDLAAARAGLAQLEADTQISPEDTGEAVAAPAAAPAESLAHVFSGASASGSGSGAANSADSGTSSSAVSSVSSSATSSATSSGQFSSSVHTLLTKVAGSLDSGSIDTAVSDLTGFLTKDGHSTGNLLSTAA